MRHAIAGGRNDFGRDESRPYIDKGKGDGFFRLALFSSFHGFFWFVPCLLPFFYHRFKVKGF